jgi:transcriptional regulator with XRE-family HTH domain
VTTVVVKFSPKSEIVVNIRSSVNANFYRIAINHAFVETVIVMSLKSEIGEQIRKARLDSGYTQGELADCLDVSRQMVVRYESGKDEPSIAVLARAGVALDVSFEIEGIRVVFESVDPRAKLQLVPHQLRLDFGKVRTYQGAIIEITPHKGKLFIRAEIPA